MKQQQHPFLEQCTDYNFLLLLLYIPFKVTLKLAMRMMMMIQRKLFHSWLIPGYE